MMNRYPLSGSGLRRVGLLDDRGQALTEYALIIPLVLLMFFGLIQIVLVAQVAQLGNYAAQAAGRVYAVRSGVEGLDGDAEDYAKKAAALVMAPVSRPAPGEQENIPLDSLDDLPGDLDDVAVGYASALYLRMASLGGGDFKIERGGDPEQVNVEIDYAYPIYLPGMAEAWSLVAGGKNIKDALNDMDVELGSGAINVSSPYPYIIVKCKAAVGYEPWSGEPRERDTVDSSPKVDEELKDQGNKIMQAKEDLDSALEEEDEACEDLQEALEDGDEEDIEEAQEAYNEAVAKRQQEQAQYNDLIGQNIPIPAGKCPP